MKTTLKDLNEHLFRALELVNEETDANNEPQSEEAVRARIVRAGAVSKLGAQIIAVGRLALDAEHLRAEYDGHPGVKLLGLDKD